MLHMILFAKSYANIPSAIIFIKLLCFYYKML